ncbi:MAG: hypothetical protein WAN52_25545 [Pseudolabrys sp.]
MSITFRVLHTFLWDSSVTGVLCTGAAKEIVIRKAYLKAKIFLFSALIAVLKNNLLLTGYRCWKWEPINE